MSNPITALVTIRYQWVRTTGLGGLLSLLADNKNGCMLGMLVLPVTSYDTSDQGFVEVAFTNPYLEVCATLFIPKSEVIAIVKTDNPEDLAKVGYKGRSITGPIGYEVPPLEGN